MKQTWFSCQRIYHIYGFYPNYLDDKDEYFGAREKSNNSKLDSCNQFRETGGYQIAEKGQFEILKKTSKILKQEKPKTAVKKLANMCNEKQHTPKKSKRSYPFNKEALVNFRATGRKPKRLENVVEKPKTEIKRIQHSVISKCFPKNCKKRSSNKNNIKCKPWVTHDHKNCEKLSAKSYYKAGEIVNNISYPPRYQFRDVKGKPRNKKKEKISIIIYHSVQPIVITSGWLFSQC